MLLLIYVLQITWQWKYSVVIGQTELVWTDELVQTSPEFVYSAYIYGSFVEGYTVLGGQGDTVVILYISMDIYPD